MNTQAAIEAAKIAAEAAARTALITAIIAGVTLLVTSVISIWSVRKTSKMTKKLGEKNIKSAEQKRYIDAISAERVKWINTIRDRFSQFIKLAHLQMGDFSYWQQKGPKNITPSAEKEIRDRFFEITYVSTQILLLLNPKEKISDEITKLQNQIKFDLNSTTKISGFNFNVLANFAEELIYLHQVVLKSEWKRVKEENKKGEEIDDDVMEKIYRSVAEKLDAKLYVKFFN